MKAHELLDHIDPAQLDYQDWLAVGMALKHEGGSLSLWDSWSQRDSKRYNQGECARKWAGFHGSGNPVTVGSLVEFAKRCGWRPERAERGPGRAYDWDDVIERGSELSVIDPSWVEDAEVHSVGLPGWRQLQTYIETLFEASDYVGYCCESWTDGDRTMPTKGVWHRQAGYIIQELAKYKDIGPAIGDYKPETGAWIRFNPLDGQGVRDLNVTSYRYALIESDTLSIEKQAAIYEQLELPIAALVHSGKKSLHAIVRIGATTMEEYRERVNFLHKVCQSNGLEIDKQNKNPSRLSRMPGVKRGGVEQSLVAVNQGKPSFEEWKNWIEEQNDSLPDIESMVDIWGNLPPLAEPLIENVVRRGHKLLLAGPSKAGKSYLLLLLAIAIAEGRSWLGWKCTQGRVLYVNLELDKASCFHRLKLIYEALGIEPRSLSHIDIWNLRGKAVPMDKLAPMLIRRAMRRDYVAVIIDPIYKVITGDENAADKMAFFCNQFDRLCTELGCAVIYCHHHSKGSQGQKSSRDRSSGSGVFARDPDAILDLIELSLEKPHRDVIENLYLCPAIERFLNEHAPGWQSSIGQDTAIVAHKFIQEAQPLLSPALVVPFAEMIQAVRSRLAQFSGWRLEGTLREFATFKPREILFTYPIHVDAPDGILKTAKADGEEAPWMAQQREKKSNQRTEKQGMKESIASAFSVLAGFDDDPVMLGDLADAMGCTPATLKKRIAQTREYVIGDDNVIRTRAQAERAATEAAIIKVRDITGRVKISDVATHLGITERAARNRVDKDERYTIVNGEVILKEEA
jgi:RecA-family ATPase